MTRIKNAFLLMAMTLIAAFAVSSAHADTEYLLGVGDTVKINVFKNPDLSIDARVSEAGTISYPLIGQVQVRGLTLGAAEKKIAEMLKEGGFVLSPQINILVNQGFNNLVSVLGDVRNPGRYSLDAAGGRLSGMLAAAGGVADGGGDIVVVSGARAGKPFRREIDIVKMASSGTVGDDLELVGGDTLFVNRASMFYIYGQVQRPGQVRLERNMTVMQALASGGGFTGKGTGRGLVRHRRDPATGKIKEESVNLDDEVKDQDVIYVKERPILMDALDQNTAFSNPSSSGFQMSPQSILAALRARWRTVGYVFVAVLVVAILLTLIWPKKYDGLASVVVDASPDPVAGTSGAMALVMQDYVTTQADVIASERVAQRVVQVTKLDQDPDLQESWRKKDHREGDITVWLADYLLKKLTVTQSNSAGKNPGNVIDITMRWADPKRAAELANAFAQVAIDTNIELKVQQAKQYGDWFIKRSRELHAELEQKQKLLSDFERTTGITSTDAKLDVESNRLTELSTALVAIENERQDSQSRQTKSGIDYESLPEVLANPVIGSLKSELATAEAKQSDLASTLGRNHPDYQAAAATVKNIKERIAQESAKIANSLDTTAHVNVRRETELRTAVEEERRKVLELKHQHDQASNLEGDVTAVQNSLDAVNQRLAQSSLESQTHQTNIVLLTSAPVPLDPASPKFLLNVGLGIFLGLFAGIAAALWQEANDPRVRQDAELLAILGVPLLGKIGSISTRSADMKKPNRRLLPSFGSSRI